MSRSGAGPGEKIRRRALTIPVVAAAFVVVTVVFPLLVVAGGVVDLARGLVTRRPWITVRLVAFLWVYLAAQVVGLVWLLAIWMASGFGASAPRMTDGTYRVQRTWTAVLFAAVRGIFSLGLEVDGTEQAATPAVFLPRHASLIDTLLPSVLISSAHDIRLRYVLKRQLLVDPALDVAGNRLPNYFVDRESKRPAAELEALRSVAANLRPDEGLLIYPEGTRFRAHRQDRLVARLRNKPELFELAAQLEHVHPPRPGGSLVLLDSGLDAVFVAHAGLEGFARVADVWDGDLVGSTIRVAFRRVPAADIPSNPAARTRWLFEQWLNVDRTVGDLIARTKA